MGYKLGRFIKETVDECIKDRKTSNETCPIDGASLKYGDSNKLNKMGRNFEFTNEFKWQMCYNMKPTNQLNTLEINHPSQLAFAQSSQSIQRTKSSFKIQILSISWISIGLTRKGHPIDTLPGFDVGSVGCSRFGMLSIDGKHKNVVPVNGWTVGDIIECRIKFPRYFLRKSVNVYFKRNEILIAKTQVNMPSDGFFPTVAMYGKSCKVRCLK